MAADSAAIRVSASYYDQGASPPYVDFFPTTWQPAVSQVQGPRRISVPTIGVTVHLDGWASVLTVVLANKDPTNYIEVAYTYPSPIGGAKTNVISLLPGASAVINGPITLASNLVLTAFGGTVITDYAILGT